MVETKQDQSMPKVIVAIASDTRLDKLDILDSNAQQVFKTSNCSENI